MAVEKILCKRSDIGDAIREAKEEWIIEVLLALGVDESVIELGFSEDGGDFEKFIYEMNKIGVDIILYQNGEVNVYKKTWVNQPVSYGGDVYDGDWAPPTEKNLVAQWKIPKKTKIKTGNSEYYEICPVEWHI